MLLNYYPALSNFYYSESSSRDVQALNISVCLFTTLTLNKNNKFYTISCSKRSRLYLKIVSLSGRNENLTLEATAHLVDTVDSSR